MDSTARIAQFEKMAADDPDNELGHFSLGKAYLEAGRSEEAAVSLKRAVDLNPTMSKAYELLGQALELGGRHLEAVDALTRGVRVADERGDMKPRDAMVAMLATLGAEVPRLSEPARSAAAAPAPAGGGGTDAGFRCSRCGRPDGKADKPPFKGKLGQRLFENVCTGCFREWVGMGTKVINELGLVMANPKDQATYDQYMLEFLQLDP